MMVSGHPQCSLKPGVVIEYDDPSHTYKIGDEGKAILPVPSVTQIISPLRDFSAIPPEALAKAGERGKNVHKAIDLIEGGGDGSGLHPAHFDSPEIGGYLRAYKKFVAYESTPKMVAGEVRVASLMYGYAGTLDQLRYAGNRHWQIWDFKTGKPNPADKVQLAGYAKALIESHNLDPFTSISGRLVYLKPDGEWEMIEVMLAEELYYWQVFLSCLTIRGWRARNGD